MKKTFILMVITVFFLSCKEEPKEQIHLSDYNHPETEAAVQNDTLVEMASKDSTAVETKIEKDSATVDSSKVVSDKKVVEEEK